MSKDEELEAAMGVFSFSGLETLMQHLESQRKSADALVTAEQAAVRPGQYVLRGGVALIGPARPIRIYAELLDPAEEEYKAFGADDDPDERDQAVEYVKQNYARPEMANFRFTRSYSVVVPEGELGDLHVSSIERVLSKEEFEAARAAGWP